METNNEKIRKAESVLLHTLAEQKLSQMDAVATCLFLLADAMAASKPRYENADRKMLADSVELVLNHIEMRRTQVKMFRILKQQNN